MNERLIKELLFVFHMIAIDDKQIYSAFILIYIHNALRFYCIPKMIEKYTDTCICQQCYTISM